MKKTLKIFIGIILIISCQEKPKAEINKPSSDFDLKTDINDFKFKMTELDTILVSFDHSLCEYQAHEKLEITKHKDSIQISMEYKEFDKKNPKWELIYSIKIPLNDTIWDFSEFVIRNDTLKDSVYKHFPRMRISKGLQQISYSTKGLTESINFDSDYNTTMGNLYNPKGFIYGFTEEEIKDIMAINPE